MRHGVWTVLGLGVFACGAWGQQPAGSGGLQGPTGGGGALRGAPLNQTQRDRLSEDIEVMRRLLERELRLIYGYPAAMAAECGMGGRDHAALSAWLTGVGSNERVNINEHWHFGGANTNRGFYSADGSSNTIFAQQHKDPHAQLLLPSAEGSYLPGYGVVYTMTLPPPSKEAKSEPTKPVGKSLSAWERTRKELRGEPIEAEKPAEQRPPSVSGTILRLLAENGQHFSNLKDNEQITVAITYRSKWGSHMNQCMACHDVARSHMGMGTSGGMGEGMAGPGASGGGGLSGAMGPGGAGDAGGGTSSGGGSAGQPVGGYGPGGAAGGPGGRGAGGGAAGFGGAGPAGGGIGLGGGGSGPAPSKPWEDRVLLGDLHMKNGRIKDALAEYGKAAQVLEDHMGKTWNWDKNQLKSAEELYGKLIQAHIANGDRAAARAVLDKFEKIPPLNQAVAANQTPGAGKPKEAPKPPALPGKLIISAPKRLLDQVGSAKMTFDDFRKAATVE